MELLEIMSNFNDLNSILGDPSGINGYMGNGLKIIAMIIFLVSMLQCLFGYKLFKFWVAVCGFFTFGILGGLISGSILENMGMAVFFSIISAILGAFIAFKLYKIGVFILCGVMGFLVGYILTQSVALGIVLALILGVVSLFFIKPVIIISTSVSSGLTAGTTLAIVLGLEGDLIGIFLGVVFAVLGILFQFSTNKGVITNTPGETENNLKNTQPILDYSLNQYSKQTTDVVTTWIKQSSVKVWGDLGIKVKNKIEIDSLSIKKEKGITLGELSENLGEIFYSIKTLKYIMPFVDYILYFISFIAIISPFLIFDQIIWSTINITLLLLVGILCFAKQRYNAIAVSFTLVTISRTIMIIRLMLLPYPKYNLFTMLVDTVILGYAAFLAINYFLKSEDFTKLKNKLIDLLSKQKVNEKLILQTSEETIVNLSCLKCGELNRTTDKFCGSCGGKIS